jgi:hypothetical protein
MAFLQGLFKGKDDPIKTYDEFWEWFIHHERTFFKVIKRGDDIEGSFFDKLSPKLAELKDGFWFLTGMFDENTAELILTADGTIKNIIFVEELIAKAPSIKRWRFTALKPASDIKDVAIRIDEVLTDQNNLFFYSNEDERYPDEVDITLVHSKLDDTNRPSVISSTWLFLDNYLGELNAVTTIDHAEIVGKDQAVKDLVPIEKLKVFLSWRESEFVEKYHGVIANTQNMTFSVLEAERNDGKPIIAVANTEILGWENKASHPWILSVQIPYDGSSKRGLPPKETNEALRHLEDQISEQLKDEEGYIYIGHDAVDNLRTIYFACKEFRKPSKILHQFSIDNPAWKITYDIYKDKYWRSLNKFNPAI